jgi:Transposase DDE domain group 1
LVALIRQRIFQIACGYEDQNDSNTFRKDPLLKLVCGKLPETEADLASQPTFSRNFRSNGALGDAVQERRRILVVQEEDRGRCLFGARSNGSS